ncbi:hypothetical protein ABZS66_00930 [Dactylosporangium sp. NPDC005572]|uniref:hypothetical protein n=1 Tax=Dactylosporangium sp. NPDC005572 TaxID=3156889 RepID=UPI0033B17C08
MAAELTDNSVDVGAVVGVRLHVVTVPITAESESTTAGIASLRVALQAGIAPADVSWVSGPTG